MVDPTGNNAATQTGRWMTPFLEVLAETGNVKLSAKAASVARSTVYCERRGNEVFAREMDEAIDAAAEKLAAEAWRRAHDGLVSKKFTKSGEPIIDPETGEQYFERLYSDALLMFLLKGMQPHKWRESSQAGGDRDGAKINEPVEVMLSAPPEGM